VYKKINYRIVPVTSLNKYLQYGTSGTEEYEYIIIIIIITIYLTANGLSPGQSLLCMYINRK